jgi:hypothetical protein
MFPQFFSHKIKIKKIVVKGLIMLKTLSLQNLPKKLPTFIAEI